MTTNATIADAFSLLSKLMDIHGENSFLAKSYSIAAYHIERLPAPLAEMPSSELHNIKGVHASVAGKLPELLQTGKLQLLEDFLANTPPGVLELLHIKGLGPKKIHIIWKEMDIQSMGELEYACNENRLTRYKGFGAKTQQNVLDSIKFYNQNLGFYLYAAVEPLYEPVKQYLENLFGKNNVLPTGDFRRQSPVIGNLSFVINDSNENIKPKFETAYPPELLEEKEDSLLYKLTNGLKLQLFTGKGNVFQRQFTTSASDEFLETFYQSLSQETLASKDFASEEEIFEEARIPNIAPCLRETNEIITKAKTQKLPNLITVRDIKGIIHNHSDWSDGANTIAQMAEHLIAKGMEYLVISDHSKTAIYANGLSEDRIRAQHSLIDELNKKYAPFKIFKSIESDILSDGSLDYNEDILNLFDLVIASVHSNLGMNQEKAMSRLLKAIENPYTTILGHPTGRLLLSRNGYPIDHKTIIQSCVKHHVIIEINANPHRLDLDWSWIDYAIEQGALLSINPDAHSLVGFDDIRFGVLAAQKGGLEAKNNLSSFSRNDFEKFIAERKTSIRHDINHI
ncbi:MAG: PHP domain-containing protein [Niabella sp.]